VRSIQQLETSTDNGHRHPVWARWVATAGPEGGLVYELGPAEGMLVARVPRYGQLRFRDRRGDPKNPQTWEFKETATNIGKIFSYRSYIQGNTLAAAVWTFEQVTAADYPQGLPLELTIRVYRSHKGKVDEPIQGSVVVRNPDTGLESREQIFSGKDFALDRILVPRKLYDSQDNQIDLFESLVTPDGRTEVWVRCLNPGQYFGMARA
ncbi:MAG: hypothetical protein GTO03_10200, partial [Planctomycetales bacterium]|nr:hypothetical protein [Planctomycetales bacterium]